jgi:hypothetical protein
MLSTALFTLALATSHGTTGHAPAPVHQSIVTMSGPHHSARFSTGTLAQLCTNASWLDRLFGKRDECSLVDPQGTSAERAYYQACARHGTTGLLDCHIGYSFRYLTVADPAGGQFAACFRGCAPFLADVQRAEDARRSEQIPMVFGAVQAVGEKVVGEIAAEATGLDLDALFDTISAGGRDVTSLTYQKGGTLVLLPDGTRIGFRPNAGGGTSPAVDINIPGFTEKQIKFHFTDH